MALLQVKNLVKRYGDFMAVNQVSFDLEAGQLLALIGPNGAGKTSTFNMIGGQMPADSGEILWQKEDGHYQDIQGWSSEKICALGVGRTFQLARVFVSLTVSENVQLALQASQGRLPFFNRAYHAYLSESLALLETVGLHHMASSPASELAYGDVKRLELAMALAHSPRLLLMDEPTAGMSPAERLSMMTLTKTIARQREMAVLFTEHSMDVVFGFADNIVVMAEGKMIAKGSPEEIKNHPLVQDIYLGKRGANYANTFTHR